MPQNTQVQRKQRKRDIAREKLTQVTTERHNAERRAESLRRKQFRYILKSHEAGLTYREIAEVVGLTEIRIAQILRAEREAS